MEHYEMAAYASDRALAENLQNRQIAQLLQKNWEQEREADNTLVRLGAQLLTEIPKAGAKLSRNRQTHATRIARGLQAAGPCSLIEGD